MQTFEYDNVLQDKNIRLLRIAPGSESSIIEIELSEISLEGATYEALSYVWGGDAKPHKIVCNRRWFCIGDNLYNFLCERRRRGSDMPLWVDAICIDQQKNEERTHQVRMMKEIYEKAERVVIWLGKELPMDFEAYQMASKIVHEFQQWAINRDDVGSDGVLYFSGTDAFERSPHLPALRALQNIFHYPWFHRMWVVQELFVARKSIMWRGTLDLQPQLILTSVMAIHSRRYNLRALQLSKLVSPTGLALAMQYMIYREKGPEPLENTLRTLTHMQVTDPRDIFFALTGVSSGFPVEFVDYNKSFREVICYFGKMILLRGQATLRAVVGAGETPLDAIHIRENFFMTDWLVFNENPQNHEIGLPSWVPEILSAQQGLSLETFYATSGLQGHRSIPCPQLQFVNDGDDSNLDDSARWWSSHSNVRQISFGGS